MWKWVNAVASSVSPGRRLVWLNMDETSIPLCAQDPRGFKRRWPGESHLDAKERRGAASLADRRARASLLALVCDDPEVQPLLPQVLLMNARTLPLRRIFAAREDVRGTPVEIWRGTSAWANSSVLVAWLAAVRRSLAPLAGTREYALLLDACPTHLSPGVQRAAARNGFYSCCVPAGMTSVLQPLDTHVFSRLKQRVAFSMEAARLQAPAGNLSREHCLAIWLRGIAVELAKAYPAAFAAAGITQQQRALSARVLHHVGRETPPPPVTPDIPSLEEFHSMAGSGKALPLGWMLQRLAQVAENRGRQCSARAASGSDRRALPVGTRLLPSFPRTASTSSLAAHSSAAPCRHETPPTRRPRPKTKRCPTRTSLPPRGAPSAAAPKPTPPACTHRKMHPRPIPLPRRPAH